MSLYLESLVVIEKQPSVMHPFFLNLTLSGLENLLQLHEKSGKRIALTSNRLFASKSEDLNAWYSFSSGLKSQGWYLYHKTFAITEFLAIVSLIGFFIALAIKNLNHIIKL